VTTPILVFHRFGPAVVDSMTVTTRAFEEQLRYLEEQHFVVIPLRALVDFRLGKGPPPPPRGVVITADDGHRSIYTHMLPLVQRYRIAVTLFIYPSAISRASYALTWEQLRELLATGLFEVQSHTYWHPNFAVEKRRRSPAEYQRFVMNQLTRSRDELRQRLGVITDMLAWPFGIVDQELVGYARTTGYVAGLTLERRHARISDDLLSLPRYLMTDGNRGRAFARLLSTSTGKNAQP
jgi:peptidoglycan/xylan/chitin deacetylase (PgdA/CDA1 family)